MSSAGIFKKQIIIQSSDLPDTGDEEMGYINPQLLLSQTTSSSTMSSALAKSSSSSNYSSRMSFEDDKELLRKIQESGSQSHSFSASSAMPNETKSLESIFNRVQRPKTATTSMSANSSTISSQPNKAMPVLTETKPSSSTYLANSSNPFVSSSSSSLTGLSSNISEHYDLGSFTETKRSHPSSSLQETLNKATSGDRNNNWKSKMTSILGMLVPSSAAIMIDNSFCHRLTGAKAIICRQ